ncbi:type II toxin-antitoxin system RelE/ParE family toxin [Nocardia sp. NBC_01388]|uniref:type II toxin-antitoxin system RelE/ParE family toxin n=1 Tax=Nocardia sp. NBC_01388 TaxID=2903596 RepID=UPI002F9073CE
MSRYLLNPAARADLDQIYDYTLDRWDIDQAETYVRELMRAFDRAAANPCTGRSCEEIRPGYFLLPAGSHTVYYRIAAAGVVEIMRILHQRMDADRHL